MRSLSAHRLNDRYADVRTSLPGRGPIVSARTHRALLPLLTAAMGAGPLLTYSISSTSSLVIADVRISAAQFGLLATVTFVTAAALSLTLGKFTDRFSVRGLLVMILAGASVSSALAAVSTTYFWLLAAMILSGAGQAMSNPVTNRAISETTPPTKRSLWVGVKQSGVQASQLLAGIGCPAVALIWHWRGALWIGSALAACAALFAWRCTPPGRARAPSSPRPEQPQMPPMIWLLAVYAFFSGAPLQATNVYLPLFAHDELGLGVGTAGLTAALAGAVGVASRIGWGRALARFSTPLLLILLGCGSAVGTAALTVAQLSHLRVLMWVGVAVHGGTALAINAVQMAGVLRTVSSTSVGRASSIIAVGMYLGFAAGPVLTGFVLDLTGGFVLAWVTTGAMYLVCVVVSVWAFHKSRRQIDLAP